MRSITYLAKSILLSLLVVACIFDTPVENVLMNSPKNEDFTWLEGHWKRVNDEAPQQTFEQWVKKSDTAYSGHGYTLIEQDTVWQEFIELVRMDDEWYFKVTRRNGAISTDFKLTQIERDKFICFNPDNDFPTHISYQVEEDSLKALIWRDSTKVPFNFIRL